MVALPSRRLAAPLAAFAIGLAALGVSAYLTLVPEQRAGAASAVGGPFSLQAADGRRWTERDLRGSPHLVFFGFTHCPDICPTKLFEISEALRALGDRGRDVRALFITVDPERDTPEVMGSYVGSFDRRIVGLSGSREEIDAVVRGYRAYARKAVQPNGDYTMEHTALVYLMGKDGRFVGSFNLERTPELAAAELARLL